MAKGGKQPLSLGKGCHFIGTAVHELLHAVGFHHEHSREDRDKNVDIVWKNVHPLARNQFKIVSSSDYPQFYGFDFDSVMLYGSTAFSRDGKSPTILRKDDSDHLLTAVYYKTGMSSVDAER
ncbi:High choriolytic enzyme 2-like protein, partial [Leptotrombidium deliense]